jgi:hypothetical protein
MARYLEPSTLISFQLEHAFSLYRDNHVEFKGSKPSTKKMLIETARKETREAPTTKVANRAMHDSRLDFSYTNNGATTALWVGAIIKKANTVFPSICNRAMAVTGPAQTLLDNFTGSGSVVNVRADLDSDDDDDDDDDGKGEDDGRMGSSDGEECNDDGGEGSDKYGEDDDEGSSSVNGCWPSDEEDVQAQ